MLHLAATETYYGMNTFDGMKWGSWSDEVKKKWDAAMDLGDAGRKDIKGHDRDYYVGILHEVREKTLAEFKKKDDAWLMAANKDPDWGLANNLPSGFTSASTNPITAGRSPCCESACRAQNRPQAALLPFPDSIPTHCSLFPVPCSLFFTSYAATPRRGRCAPEC